MPDETNCSTREPTREQRLLLSRIVNSQQRQALITAIETGEDIPSYAWEPIPEHLDATALYTDLQRLIAQNEGPETQSAGQQVRPTLIATIDCIFAEDTARAQADIELLRQQAGRRSRRWISCTKAAALIQQARWPAEAWIGQKMLGELARGEITLGTFRKRWHNVITSEARLARMRAKATREQPAKRQVELPRHRGSRRAKTTDKKAGKRRRKPLSS